MSLLDLTKWWTEPTKIKKKKIGLLVQYSSKIFVSLRFGLKIGDENQNFEMFEEVVHSFGKSDGDII